MDSPDRLIRRSDVQQITGMTRYMIDMLEEIDAFPKRMQVGQRNVFWSEAEVFRFVEQVKKRRGEHPAAPKCQPIHSKLSLSHDRANPDCENPISCSVPPQHVGGLS